MQKKTPQSFLLGLVFLLAFCSFSYEILIASRLSRLLGGGYFIYPGCISLFILFMGLGSSRWYRRESFNERETLARLLKIEILLTISGLVSIFGINSLGVESFSQIHVAGIIFGVGMAGWIGFLSGQELPLIFRYSSLQNMGQRVIRQMIFFDYAASFAASVTALMLFFPSMGIFKTSVLISFLNLSAMGLIIWIARFRGITFSRVYYSWAAGLIGLYLIVGAFLNPIERYVLT